MTQKIIEIKKWIYEKNRYTIGLTKKEEKT